MPNLYQHLIFSDDNHFVLFMQKLHKRFTLTSVLAGYKVLLAMLATAIFEHLFIKSNIAAIDRLVVVNFHTNIANRWLFMTEIILMAIIFYS